MINSSLLLAVQSTAPSTPEWSPMVGLTMILCNLLAITIGYYGINKQNRGKGQLYPLHSLECSKASAYQNCWQQPASATCSEPE